MAWEPLGWTAVAFSEIDAFPCAVLEHHYPDVPNLGDMTRYKEWSIEEGTVDILVGGTPCQSFSVAGLRKGMDDPRGNLALVYLGVADRTRPRWVVWENVPGVLSSNDGRDLGSFLGALEELGYGWAYRILDAQYYGVAQRRRRVFVVGHLGDWRGAAAVLFERESLRWDPAPRREAGEGAAPTIGARTTAGGGLGTDAELDGALIPSVSPAMKARDHKGPSSDGDGDGDGLPLVPIAFNARMDPCHGPVPGALDEDGQTQCIAFSSKDHGADAGVVSPTLRACGNAGAPPAVAFHENQRAEVTTSETVGSLKSGGGKPGQGYPAVFEPGSIARRAGPSGEQGTVPTLRSEMGDNQPAVRQGMSVRRLTPRECERLQGFPDDYTLVPYRGKPAKDGPRYKALGNSMAVPVMRWIGERWRLVSVSK